MSILSELERIKKQQEEREWKHRLGIEEKKQTVSAGTGTVSNLLDEFLLSQSMEDIAPVSPYFPSASMVNTSGMDRLTASMSSPVYSDLQAKRNAGAPVMSVSDYRNNEDWTSVVLNSDGIGDGFKATTMPYPEEKPLTAGEKALAWTDWMAGNIHAGTTAFTTSIGNTLDATVGNILKGVGWENNPISKLNEGLQKNREYTLELRDRAAEKLGLGKGAQIVEALTEGTVAAVPMVLEAMLTAGSSLAPTAASLADDAIRASGTFLQKIGLTTSSMLKNPQFWMSYAQTYGNEYYDAVENGASEAAAVLTATAKSLINSGVEIGIDGGSGMQGLMDDVAKDGKRLLNWVESSLEEGMEEVVQGFIGRLVDKFALGKDVKVLDPWAAAQEFGMGAAIGGILGSGQLIADAMINGAPQNARMENAVDRLKANALEAAKNSLTETEQQVVDKEYETRLAEAEKDGKLTDKEKAKLYDRVIEDMDKGYISTDTIEEVLGGDTYKSYQDTVKAEEDLIQQEKSLAEESKKLEAMVWEKMTGEQQVRRDELRGKLAEIRQKLADMKKTSSRDQLKTKLGEEVQGLANGSRLMESYNEAGRRKQAFEADLSQYDAKQQEVIKKAVESGILNNTRRTHEFVDFIAKISADKGVLFDFTNNAKLKESGFAVNGKFVNGYVTKDGVTINIQSTKSLNSVVGHEITHVLEGTDFYNELQSAVMEYAKTKGDYKSRYDALAKLYENVDGADINAELTADLVGDYLFTDSDFIGKLSTEHRNVFQKIFDEVKHLLKLATAGSKEAQQLEKVKRAFEKAYRATKNTTDGGVKRSLSDSTGKQLTQGQVEYFKDSKARDDEGRLVKVYHSTHDAGFFEFKGSKNSDSYLFGKYGKSVTYFTDSKQMADSYAPDNTTVDTRKRGKVVDSARSLAFDVRSKLGIKKSGQYEGYVNITNPYVVDAQGRDWNAIDNALAEADFNTYMTITSEEKYAVRKYFKGDVDEDYEGQLYAIALYEAGASEPRTDAEKRALDRELKSNRWETTPAEFKDLFVSALRKLGSDSAVMAAVRNDFSAEGMKEFYTRMRNTNDIVLDALKLGTYDGVIIKNVVNYGSYADASDLPPGNLYVTFNPEQFKAADNQNPTPDTDIRYSLSENEASPNEHLANRINQSMTMAQAKQMIQRAFVLGDIKNWFDGEYKDGDAWLRGEGASEVALIIDNEYSLQSAYLDRIQGILDGDFYTEDVLEAYLAGTLTGKVVAPKNTAKINLAASVVVADQRFYAPQEIENAKALYETASVRMTKANQAEVMAARAKILLYAHNKGAAETLGLTVAELNNKLRSWSNYSAKARDISIRINAGVQESNRWTGIENMAYISQAQVTPDDVKRLVKSVKGRGDDYQNKYVARTMLSLDTHIDWSWLNFWFDTYSGVNAKSSSKCNGYYLDSQKLIHVKENAPNTVAHEMGHALDYQWARELGLHGALTEAYRNTQAVTGDARVWFDHFKEFTDTLVESSDIRSSYSGNIKETFARFVAKFVEWTEQVSTGRSAGYETSFYNDKFTGGQFVQFARLLQEKAALDANGQTKNTSFSGDTGYSLSDINDQPARYGDYNVYGEDVALETDEIAPVAESAADNTQENAAIAAEEMFPDDTAALQEEYEQLVAKRDDLLDAMNIFAAVDDFANAERMLNELGAVQERIDEIEADESDRLASIREADEPVTMDSTPEDVADNVPLTKTMVAELAKDVQSRLGLPAKKVAEVRDLIARYSAEEFPSRAHLYAEIYDRFGTYTESYVDEDLKGVKALLRSYGISVDESIKRDIADYGQLMRSNFGKVRFSKDGLPVDVAYMEFQEVMPGLFPESINVPADQLLRIIEVANMDVASEQTQPIDSETLEEVTNLIANRVTEFKQIRKETLANKHGRESFQSLMEDADHYVPPVKPNTSAPTRREMTASPEDIAPVFDTTSGQQALMPEEPAAEAPKAITRKQLHENIVDDITTTFREKGYEFTEVLKKAKDLSTFATVDNTPQRVMEKALGYKEGQILADMTVNKVAQNETEGIRWLNSFTDKKDGLLAKISKQYGIKPGSKQSAAAQMYAEGFYVGENDAIIAYGDAELAKDFPNAKVQENIKKLARDPRIRMIYDETLAAINESRTRNAYPEIPRLDNYFLHFRAMEDTFSRLGLPFNPNDIRAKDLPTDLNGVTADLKPGQPYFASAMHRKGKRTSFDLLGGLEKYLTSAKNQIYHIDDIQTLRALRNYVAQTYGQAHGLENLDTMSDEEAEQRIEDVYKSHLSTFAKFLNEEANVLAGKTSLIDRGLEGVIGRRGMTFLDTLNRQVGANMVGFNVSSSLTNFLAPVQAFAKTNKFDFVKAMAQTAANKIGSIAGKGDSFVEDSPVMIRRKGAERFYRTPWEKVADKGYIFMSMVDDLSTEIIARTKYNEFTRKGMDSQQAHIETDKWVSRLMGDRSLGQQPQLYNSKTLGLITKFQLEVRNQLDSQFYDTIQEAKVSTEQIENKLLQNAKKAAKITSTFAQLAVMQHLFGKAFESVAGYNPAFDIIEVLIKTMGWDDDEEDEDTVLDNIEQGFLELLGDLPYTSTLTGGRIPIASALPVTELIKGVDQYGNEKNRWDTIKEAAPYYFLPGGYGQIKKTKAGLEMFDDEHPVAGSYTDSGNLRFPVEDTTWNRVHAGLFGQWASENARDYFDNERKPMRENQIEEFLATGMEIQNYWDYREGLSEHDTLEEKVDYIAGLDLPVGTKNILVNNLTDRKESIDLSNYDEYGGLEEMDFAMKYPDKYEVAEAVGGYQSYMQYQEDMKGMKLAEKADYIAGLNLSTEQKNLLINSESDRKEPIDLTGIEDYSSFEEFEFAKNYPGKYALAKAVGGYDAYQEYSEVLSGIKNDTDENGQKISNTRRPKVYQYIYGLDIPEIEKHILFKSQYPSDDSHNMEIIEYLVSREDISYDETVAILKKLEFEVSEDGTVRW